MASFKLRQTRLIDVSTQTGLEDFAGRAIKNESEWLEKFSCGVPLGV